MMRRTPGNSGSATLIALLVLAASAAVIALQARSLEQQSVEDLLDTRSEKSRRFGSMALGHAHDIFARKDLVINCDASKKPRVEIGKDAKGATRSRLQQMLGSSGKTLTLSYCDPDSLTDRDRAALYVRDGELPKTCKPIIATLSFERLSCGDDWTSLVANAQTRITNGSAVVGDARSSSTVSAQMTIRDDQKVAIPGCPFLCHMGGSPPRQTRVKNPEYRPEDI